MSEEADAILETGSALVALDRRARAPLDGMVPLLGGKVTPTEAARHPGADPAH